MTCWLDVGSHLLNYMWVAQMTCWLDVGGPNDMVNSGNHFDASRLYSPFVRLLPRRQLRFCHDDNCDSATQYCDFNAATRRIATTTNAILSHNTAIAAQRSIFMKNHWGIDDVMNIHYFSERDRFLWTLHTFIVFMNADPLGTLQIAKRKVS